MNRVLRNLILVFLLAPLQSNFAHSLEPFCGNDYFTERHRALDSVNFDRAILLDDLKYSRYLEGIHSDLKTSVRASCDVYRIPVVIHVVHDGGSSNLPISQIQFEMDRLNDNYRRIPLTSGYGSGVDTRIQFSLATKDPLGNSSNGITRHLNPSLSNHNYGDGITDEYNSLTALAHWPNCLNIYIVNQIIPDTPVPGTILGYGPLPWFTQYQNRSIVIRSDAFGVIGGLQGTTATHEIGHWFGLLHPFQFGCSGNTGGSCLNGGDRVCDTPQAFESSETCTNRNTCDESPCDFGDPEDNYMGYTSCANAFTKGQAERLYFYLDDQLSYLWQPSNLVSTGIDGVPPIYSEPTPGFTESTTLICPGSSVTFTDLTEGCAETYNWIFPGGTPISSSDPNPVVTYALPGDYPVQLTVSNAGGYSKMITKTAHIKVADTGIVPPYAEGFESGSFAPVGWKIVDEAGDGGWERKTLISSEGNASAMFPAYNSASCNSYDYMVSPLIDLTGSSTASLKFDYAYMAVSASSEEADQMVVSVLNECGEELASGIFEGQGFVLGSVLNFFPNGPFEPADLSQWKTIDIGLNEYLGEKIYIKFNFFSLQGQNFYLDNVVIDGFSTGIEPLHDLESATTVVPNPFQQGFDLQFQLPKSESMRLEIVDISGKLLFTSDLGKVAAGTHEISLDAPEVINLAGGIYFLNLYTDAGRATKKLVKF